MGYNPFTLAGKTILVTGASSGIGRSVSIECSKMGAVMYITARNEQRLNETLSMMQGQGHKMIVADLCDEDSIIALVAGLPKLDGVVHNAGVGDRTLCKMVKESDINRVMSANFEGPVLLQKYLQKQKKINKEASIVFIASRAPFAPTIGNALYSASKGAIIGYSKVLAASTFKASSWMQETIVRHKTIPADTFLSFICLFRINGLFVCKGR